MQRLKMASALDHSQQDVEDTEAEVLAIQIKMVGAEGSQAEAAELLRVSLATEESKYISKYQEVMKYQRDLEAQVSENWKQEMAMMELKLAEGSKMGVTEAQEQVQAARKEIRLHKENLQAEARVTEEAILQRQAAAQQEFAEVEESLAKQQVAFQPWIEQKFDHRPNPTL